MKWNSSLYDQEHNFVFHFGENVLELLKAKPGERVLDLGCGTGYLADKLREEGVVVTGIDASPEMIQRAKENYPQIDFSVAAAEQLRFHNEFDAVFSNAVLHWVKDQKKALAAVFSSLKPGGRFVAEMGAKGNVEKVRKAMIATLSTYGYSAQATDDWWFFPSTAEYATLLEGAGFVVNFVACFDRPTLLQHQAAGVKNWIAQFAPSWLSGVNNEHKEVILNEVIEILAPDYTRNGEWYADYKRLRFIATKPA